jgi:hypothetical protein
VRETTRAISTSSSSSTIAAPSSASSAPGCEPRLVDEVDLVVRLAAKGEDLLPNADQREIPDADVELFLQLPTSGSVGGLAELDPAAGRPVEHAFDVVVHLRDEHVIAGPQEHERARARDVGRH